MKTYYLLTFLLFLGITSASAQVKDVLIFNSSNGSYPHGSVILSGKRLYGMTYSGGMYGDGTIFAVDTDDTHYAGLTNLWGTEVPKGGQPRGSLLLSRNKLYGMTSTGGADNYGCIFSVDTAGNNYEDMYDFNNTNGGAPWGALILVRSNLYGMAQNGGNGSGGVIFRIDTTGNNYTVIYNFSSSGKTPKGDLTLVGNKFYGMASVGGMYGDGVVFSVDTSGNNYKAILNFWGGISPEGATPTGSPTYINGKLYGMTQSGGAYSDGVIFSVDTSGNNYIDMLDFNGTNGNSPYGSLLLEDTLLYGMTCSGGTSGYGNIFSIDTSGKVFNNMISFNGNNADNPYGNLTFANGVFYGMTSAGGSGVNGYGAVFTTNTCKLAVSFDSVNVACYGDSMGTAIAILTGGTAPYTYNWSNSETTDSATTDTATELIAGTYSVTVTDTKGCISFASTIINQPAAPLTATSDSVKDDGSCDGVASIRAFGGTPPYTYLWTTEKQTTDTIKNQCAGTYSVTITDSNGCTLTTSVTINTSTGVNIVGNSQSVTIYPEPTNGYFTIEGITQGQKIELYDYTGQLLSRTIADNGTMHFDISDKANGIYLIQILNKDGSEAARQKIVKIQ